METAVELKSSQAGPAKLDLSQIIKLSQSKSFVLPEFKSISKSQLWAPENITPWYHLPSYTRLPDDVRLRYNQLWALAVNEIFSLFEMEFLVRILQSVQTNQILKGHPLLAEALEHFCEEEKKHSEMFWRLGEAAAPELYPTRKFHFVSNASLASRSLLNLVTHYPVQLLMWVWMAVFFEERTLKYSKEYLRWSSKSAPLEPHFLLAHRLHMIEEVRHVRMDAYLVDAFYTSQPAWKKKIAAWMMKQLIQDFASPRRMSYVFARKLQVEFPDSATVIQQIIKELPQLKTNRDFQEVVFGLDATERTRELMAQHPEFDGIWDFMK